MLLVPDIFEILKNHWMLVSFLAPMFWAAVNVIDVYFVGKVYRDEIDGTIISGIFQIIPFSIISLFFLKINLNQFVSVGGSGNLFWIDPIILLAILGGFLFTSSFYFYFKALFKHNDVAFLQIIWGLTIIVVPLLAFLFWGEKLSALKYVGMGTTLLGAILLSTNKKLRDKFSLRYLWVMIWAVVILSLSMVFENRVYTELSARGLNDQGFLVGFLGFSLGAFLAGVFFALAKNRNPFPLIKRYALLFILLEGVSFFGNLASQRAIDIAPSVSFVATIETFVPVFVLIYSLLILFVFSLILKKKTKTTSQIYQEQTEGILVKIMATAVMAVGVYIIS